METGLNAAFIKLKPICDCIAVNPSEKKLNELKEIITTSPTYVIQQFHEYIIFPLYINLENNRSISNTLKKELLDTLKYLILKIKLNKLKVFLQLCMTITTQIFDKQTSLLIATTDEELKLSAILCLNTAYNNVSSDILMDLYSKSNKIYFPQCIYLCIQVAKNEKMRNLRLAAINCLMTISYAHDSADFTDKVLRKQVADSIMFFLPGIVIALQNIATGDEKQGHKITSLSIKALNRIIILHMEDYELQNENEAIFEFPVQKTEKETDKIISKVKNIDDMRKKLETEKRTSEWYKTTAQNLQKIIENLVPLQSHYHEIVRDELGDFCTQILLHCTQHLENSLRICVEILLSLSEDDNPKVSAKCKKSLELILKLNQTYIFMEALEENFYNVVTGLPRIINGTDVQKQLSALNLLAGYLRLLGPENLFRVFHLPHKLKRFVECLILISTFEKSNVTLFEEYSIRNFESISETPVTWKQFKYIDDKLLLKKFVSSLHILSYSEANEIVIDNLIDIFLNEYEHRNEIVFLLNEIISVNVENSKNSIRLINNILKIYIEEENWYLPTDAAEYSLSEIHNNIIQMCLLVEGIGNMSNALGINFKSYLLKILYIVLERAGNAQPLLSAAGLLSLLSISKSCGYRTVTDLIVQNTDYFSFHVTKRLKKLDTDVAVLDVLNVVMRYSTIEVLPSIMYIINEVLIYSCDKYQEQNILSFLRVFHSFVLSLKRWMNLSSVEEDRIVNLLKEYKKSMDFLHASHENTDFTDEIMNKPARELYEEDMAKSKEELENEYHLDNDSKKPELPETIKLTVAVLKRSLNFLPNKNRERKLLTLNILMGGIEIIKDWEDELLPLIHLIWSPFIERFKEIDDPLIINRSFELLIVLAMFSKDFIRSRTSKNILNEICNIIKTLSTKSYLKDRGSAYRYNQEYKLQLIILNNIAELASDLEMSVHDVDLIIKSTLPYLSCRQPLPLQESVINCYKTLAYYDFDTVWFNLLDIWGVQSNVDEINKNEFNKNTEIVLKQLEAIHW